MFRHLLATFCMLAAVLLTTPAPALAKAETTTQYPYEQVWPAAVRFVRIDAGFEILDKDAEAGYILFRVSEQGKQFRGALELVRIRDDRDRPAVKLILHIEDRPSYMERGLIERLEQKLREQLGPLRPRPQPKQPPAKPEQDPDASNVSPASTQHWPTATSRSPIFVRGMIQCSRGCET